MTPEKVQKLNESENHREQLTDTLFDEQYERIKDAYGEEAAENANYGWGH